MGQKQTLSDAQLLDLMDRLDNQGQTSGEVAARMGLSRSAVCGLRFRVQRDSTAEDLRPLKRGEVGFGQGPVTRPENMDGGMPARWWAKPGQKGARNAKG